MIFTDEFNFMKEVILPFLQDEWDEIDLPDPTTGWRDGRISLEELSRARESAFQRKDLSGVFILDALLVRYEPVCRAFPDGCKMLEEPSIGMSKQDIMHYTLNCRPKLDRSKGNKSFRKKNARLAKPNSEVGA